jgi:hypothetical protein
VVDMTGPEKSFISLLAVPSLVLAVLADPARADLIVCTCSEECGHSYVCSGFAPRSYAYFLAVTDVIKRKMVYGY